MRIAALHQIILATFALLFGTGLSGVPAVAEQPAATQQVPVQLRKWLRPQEWTRDTAGPVLQLGQAGKFDDTHLLAPCVAKLDDQYYLWYNGCSLWPRL